MILNNQISGSTRVYGVIGDPIKHTLSPVIHNTIAQEMGHNLVYIPFHVQRSSVGEGIKGAYALQIQGLNVTVPHKQAVIPYLVDIDPMAQNIGAVNTLKYYEEGYKGYNTDAMGLLQSLQNHQISINNKKILIIGAGGAARAAAMMAANEKPSHIWVTNRTFEKAVAIAEDVSRYYKVSIDPVPWNEFEKIGSFDICIQSTSMGLSPYINETPVKDSAFYKKFHVAVDLIYNPAKTLFLSEAEKAGCQIINGFEMLFFQGVKAYEIWNDLYIPMDLQKEIMDQIWVDFCQRNQLK